MESTLFQILEKFLQLSSNTVCALYLYIMFRKVKLDLKNSLLYILYTLIISSICTIIAFTSLSSLAIDFMILILFMLISLSERRLKISNFIISVISITTANCFRILSLIISGFVLYIFNIINNYLICNIISVIIQILLTYFLMKIKRFRSGFEFLNNTDKSSIGIIISGLIILINGLISIFKLHSVFSAKILIITISVLILTMLIFMIMWFKFGITENYKEKLQKREEERLQNELSLTEKEISELSENNAYLKNTIESSNYTIEQIRNLLNNLDNNILVNDIQNLFEERATLINKSGDKINADIK